MQFTYNTKGTCSKQITFDINDGVVSNVRFLGGCNGNLQGISKLVEGLPATQIKQTLSGIKCGYKSTSCPDQLSLAVAEALEAEAKAD